MGVLCSPTAKEAFMTRPRPFCAVLPQLPEEQRLRALEAIIPLALVQQILQQTGHAKRHCRVLPHWFVLWLVLAMGLFADDSLPILFKRLQRYRKGSTPASNTIAAARAALGVAPLRRLCAAVVRLLTTPQTPGAFYQNLRLMALDGWVLNLADSAANARVFGYPKGGRGRGAFPQARVLGLCEVGSHAFCRWLVKPCRRSEGSMAGYVLRGLQPDMLLLWDRNFLNYKTLRQVQVQQAQLLARVKSNWTFTPIAVLPDGSYLAKYYPSAKHRAKDQDGVLVRLIEYTLDDPGRPSKDKVHRLLTTLLDAKAHPAEELIVLYHQRWEEEICHPHYPSSDGLYPERRAA
jgi:hypothetical protein